MTDNFRPTSLYSDEGRAIYEEGYRVGYELGKGDVQKVADESYDLGYAQGRISNTPNYSPDARKAARELREQILKDIREGKYDA